MDALETLGTIIGDGGGRDAIHIAVVPVTAAVKLFPAQDIGIVDGGVGPCDKPLGIVDPFLKAPVMLGERFWMLLYPRTITSLRHVWSHPEFGSVDTEPSAQSASPSKARSEAWLRDFVEHADCPGYERVVAAAVDGGDSDYDDEYLHFDGSDAHGEIPDEFWDHIEVVTGLKPPKRAKYFSCSC